jgi:hypothetical protein
MELVLTKNTQNQEIATCDGQIRHTFYGVAVFLQKTRFFGAFQ